MNDYLSAAINARPEPATPIDGLSPWSARVRTDPSSKLLLVLGCFVAIFFAWASLFSIDRITRGNGRVLPRSRTRSCSTWKAGSSASCWSARATG